MAAPKIAHDAYKGPSVVILILCNQLQRIRVPSVVKEIFYGISLALFAGSFWKMHHWNNQRRTKEFYDLLEKGEISVVVEDE